MKHRFSGAARQLMVSVVRTIIAVTVIAPGVKAQAAFPDRPIRLLVPFTPGGVSDGSARIVAKALSQKLGQNVIVENRPGAAGLIAGQLTVQARPDGYTLMLGYNGTLAIDPWIFKKMPYDSLKELTAVGRIGEYPSVLSANPGLHVKTWHEVSALAKTRPDGLYYGTSGFGSTENLVGVLVAQKTGAKLVHVPYQGAGPALLDAVGGHIPLSVTSLAGGLPFIRSGKLQAIAISGDSRSKSAPGIPTFEELGVPVVVNSWVGLVAPAKTPQAIIDKLNSALNAELVVPDVRDSLFQLGIVATPGTPASFNAEIARDYARYGPAVEAAGIKGTQ